MALESLQQKYVPRDQAFYRNNYHRVFYFLMIVIVLSGIATGVVLYLIMTKPLPVFAAIKPDGQKMQLTPYEEPNLLPDTIIRWASKAATTAYTFNYVNYNKQIAAARPYFTETGWQDYLRSAESLINNIVQNQLFVNGVVSGTPVISNAGPLPGKGYTWRVQIPFLVTYQSANISTKRNFYVTIVIVRVPTDINPQGIGIDQFVMVY